MRKGFFYGIDKLMWFLSFASSIFAIIYYNTSNPTNAIQQAALASMTLIIVILPYCLARACAEMYDKSDIERFNILEQNMNELLNNISSILEIQKIDLINKISCANHKEQTYELVTEKIELLKLLNSKQIISNEELEQLKTKLLTNLKDLLNEKLKTNDTKV